MIGWLLLTGIITGFILGTYYLYQYWRHPVNEVEDYFEESLFNKPDDPSINKKNYEFAYQQNTSFNQEVKPQKNIHKVYAFHPVKTPEDKDVEEDRKEGYVEEDNTSDEKLAQEVSSIEEEKSKINFEEENIKDKEEGHFYEVKDHQEGGGSRMPEVDKVDGLELIKTPVVIGENVIQKMEVSDLPLDIPAIKVREVNATIQNLETDVIEDKVIIQGTIHKQVFYVGADNIIHHQTEDINFSYFIDIPGAEPGMEVLIEPTVEHVVSHLILDGSVLHQKVVVQFFVKVLSVQQLIVETGSGPLVKAERVIGENTVQTMVENDVNLAVEATKIVDVSTEVVDMDTEVIEDKVIVQGIIHKQLFYIGTDEVEHHQAEDIPFSEFVDIPGAEAGMNVQVHPEVEHVKQEICPDGTAVNQEIVLELFVKVTETVQVNIATGEDSLVMLPEVIGENTKQILSETTLELDQPAIKIKDIQAGFMDVNAVVIKDKVIVQGIIHKQIFFIGEDDVEYHQEENVPFSTFVDVMGARPGMDVDVQPEIAYIKPELSPEGDILVQKVIGDLFVKVSENIQFNVHEVGPDDT